MIDFAQLPLLAKLANVDMRLSMQDLTADEAAAMLAPIHADLEQPQGHERADYEQYAQLGQCFRQQLPDVCGGGVANWQGPHPGSAHQQGAQDAEGGEKANP